MSKLLTFEQYSAQREASIRKSFELKAEQDEESPNGILKGNANGIGIMDRGGDVIAPGFFSKKVRDNFLKIGFISNAHDWDTPIGMPTVCDEKKNCLYVEAEFHSTQDAQDVRTRCTERMAKGLAVGLSVGFRPDYEQCCWYQTGKALYDDCVKQGIEVDEASCKAWKGYCRLLKGCRELYEFGVVTIPMNQVANATDVKSADAVEDRGSEPFEAQLETALGAVEAVIARAADIQHMRAEKGLTLSKKHLPRLDQVIKSTQELVDALNAPDPLLVAQVQQIKTAVLLEQIGA